MKFYLLEVKSFYAHHKNGYTGILEHYKVLLFIYHQSIIEVVTHSCKIVKNRVEEN